MFFMEYEIKSSQEYNEKMKAVCNLMNKGVGNLSNDEIIQLRKICYFYTEGL